MISPLLDIFFQYGGAVVAGIIVGLLCKVFFARQMQGKIREYQSEIVKSHSKILSLQAEGDQLQRKIKDLETKLQRERLVLN
jgi:septal ring factor EnvC (AmiA/AmiB activator)